MYVIRDGFFLRGIMKCFAIGRQNQFCSGFRANKLVKKLRHYLVYIYVKASKFKIFAEKTIGKRDNLAIGLSNGIE